MGSKKPTGGRWNEQHERQPPEANRGGCCL